MSDEPRWLIGGPERTEPEPVPGPYSIFHARWPLNGKAVCGRAGWLEGDLEKVDCPVCLEIITQPTPEIITGSGRYQGKTVAQWRQAQAADPDAHIPAIARKYELCCGLATNDGIWEFEALFTLTGALVPESTWVRTKRGIWVWRIGAAEPCDWFHPSKHPSGARRRTRDAEKGFALGLIRARGYVGATGRGGGLGYFVGRVEESPIEIVDNGSLGTRYQDR